MYKVFKNSKKKQAAAVDREGPLVESYEKNLELLRSYFENDTTIAFRELVIHGKKAIKICIAFAKGMVDEKVLNQDIIATLLAADFNETNASLQVIGEAVIACSGLLITTDIHKIVSEILRGNSVLLMENCREALILNTQGFKTRSIAEPVSEKTIRGPKEGFTEALMTNITLLRRRISSADLKFEIRELGKQTKTSLCICYMENIVNKKFLAELDQRLDSIKMDVILDSGYVAENIRDAPFSPFETIGYSERPDKVAANILEGRIAVLVDGSPSVLTLPFLFLEYFQSSDDYYNDFWFSSFNRLLRFMAFFLSTSVAALYVAITTYHQEIIPTPLLLSISAARQGLPFPTIIEALGMIITFSILRELGSRMPTPFGSTLGFVGAVVLGQAAVSARFISAPMVIIVGLTGISSYLLPHLLMPLNVIRIGLLILVAFLGHYGFVLGIMALVLHLMTLRSFGVPYMLNLALVKTEDVKDTAVRLPWWYMTHRPRIIGKKNPVRVDAKSETTTR